VAEAGIDAFALVFAEATAIALLLFGTGEAQIFPAAAIRSAFATRLVPLEAMDTGAAVRTYNVLACRASRRRRGADRHRRTSLSMATSFEAAARHCDALVRSADKDRWLTALFVPEERRPLIHALYAFNAELARIRDQVSQPMLGEIRLQWWEDAVNAIYGAPRPTIRCCRCWPAPLRRAICRCTLSAT